MAEKINRGKLTKILYSFVLASFILPVAFLIYKIIVTDPSQTGGEGFRSQADYILMLVQCALGIVVLQLPTMLSKKFRFDIPTDLYILYIVFLYCAIFLGEVRNFYYVIPYWDTVLHGLSGMMSGSFGFMVITVLNRDEHITFSLSPLFVALFAFCFSMTLGAVWEIYEFTFDGLLGLNMQKFALEDGTQLVGHAALADTMKDIIVDGVGTLLVTVYGFLSLKYNKGWLKPPVIHD